MLKANERNEMSKSHKNSLEYLAKNSEQRKNAAQSMGQYANMATKDMYIYAYIYIFIYISKISNILPTTIIVMMMMMKLTMLLDADVDVVALDADC